MPKLWSDIYLDLDIRKIAEEMDDGVNIALEIAAQRLTDIAEHKFMTLTDDSGTGETLKDFFSFKSFWKDGGWVSGVFGTKTSPWEESVAGRSHFFEYGRSAPGKGKGHGGPQSVSQRAQRPRPFIRPARNQVKRELGGITGKELSRVAKRLNRHPELSKGIPGLKIA